MENNKDKKETKKIRVVQCPICERTLAESYTTKHHLVPKSRKGKETVSLCLDCGKMVHKLITLKEMEEIYYTIEAI